MKSVKYIGLDVHQATISIAVLDANGKLVMQSVIATQASTILDFLHGLRGELHVTFEEGTAAQWLYALLKPHVSRVLVCDPRKSARMNTGNKNDRIDARKLAELLRAGQLSAVFHDDTGAVRTLRELARSYLNLTQDVTRVMNRIKGVYRSQAIACASKRVYTLRHRSEWLEQLQQPGQRRRADRLYAQLDLLQPLRQQACRELLAESRKYPVRSLLQQIPVVGPIRAALLIALIQTPHRFRNKRLFWTYSGLGVQTESSGDYVVQNGELRQSNKYVATRGLKENHNHDLKYLFKSMAQAASMTAGPLQDYYRGLLQKGIRPAMARLTLARKLAAIVLVLWKKGASFDPTKLTTQAA
jgi:transposase